MPEQCSSDIPSRISYLENMQSQILGRLSSIEEDRKEVKIAYQDRFDRVESTIYGDDEKPGLREDTRQLKKVIEQELIPTVRANNIQLIKIMAVLAGAGFLLEMILKFGFGK